MATQAAFPNANGHQFGLTGAQLGTTGPIWNAAWVCPTEYIRDATHFSLKKCCQPSVKTTDTSVINCIQVTDPWSVICPCLRANIRDFDKFHLKPPWKYTSILKISVISKEYRKKWLKIDGFRSHTNSHNFPGGARPQTPLIGVISREKSDPWFHLSRI